MNSVMNQVSEPRFQALLPLILFLCLFIGSGIYYMVQGHPYAFYQISPVIAIIPAIVMSFWFRKTPFNDHLKQFIDGVRDDNIIIMCLIYLLAGAFAVLTQHIGCIDATVNLGLQLIPASLLLPGIFIITSFIATAMGTSMGTIATMTPLAVTIALQSNLSCPVCIGAVVGGAMFGDNLSLVSDTTIASVSTQGANNQLKFMMNLRLAMPAMILTFILYFYQTTPAITLVPVTINYILILPYVAIITLSLLGFNVFAVLLVGCCVAAGLGLYYTPDFTMATVSNDVIKGCQSMQEILVLSLLIGGLSHIMNRQGGLAWVMSIMTQLWDNQGRQLTHHSCQIILCILVSLADMCTANNTVAIILCGPLAKQLQLRSHISPERSACLIDVFSCVVQGMLPYSAQILLASSIAGLSPLTLLSNVYYCPILGLVTLIGIYVLKDKMICR